MTEYPVAKLSGKAAKVLLSLVLTRHRENQFTQAEFAILTGLDRHSVRSGLVELEEYGLVTMITQEGQSPQGVRVNLGQEYLSVFEEVVEESTPEQTIRVEEAPLAERADNARSGDVLQEELDGQSEVVPEGRESVAGSEVAEEEDDHWTRALQYADKHYAETKSKKLQKQALHRVWLDCFPLPEYQYSTLTDSFASQLLAGERSSEWVAGVIYRAVEHAKSKIGSPRSYISVAMKDAVAKLEKQKQKEKDESTEITPDMWKLVENGRKQFYGET